MIHDPRRRHPGAAGSTAWPAPSTTAGVPAESTASPRVDARDVLAASTFMPLLYGIASLVPEAGLWGLHLGGFLRPGIGALLGAFWAASLGMAWWRLDRELKARPPARAIRASMAPAIAIPLATATLAASLALALPAALPFVGDALLRQGAIASETEPAALFPQATALDLALYVRVPQALAGRFGIAPEEAARLVGAAGAALFGAAAGWFATGLGLAAVPAAAIAAMLTLQPALGLFTGYSKAFAILAPLVLFAMAAAIRIARGRRGLAVLALATTLAIAAHRSGLALLPLLVAGTWFTIRAPGRDGRPRLGELAWALLPAAALVAFLPGSVVAMLRFDGAHLAGEGGHRSLYEFLGSLGWHDRLQLVLRVAPLAPLVPLLFLATGREPGTRRERWLFALALVPQLLLVAMIRPKQGLYRDWDVFAMSGTLLTAAAAWLTARLALRPAGHAMLIALVLAGIAPGLGWIALDHDAAGSRSRIVARVEGSPAPAPNEAARTLSFLAGRDLAEQRYDRAADQYRAAARFAPSASAFVQWGMAETLREQHAEARALYARAAAIDSNLVTAWMGIASASSRLGDREEMVRAGAQIRRLSPDHPMLLQIPGPPR